MQLREYTRRYFCHMDISSIIICIFDSFPIYIQSEMNTLTKGLTRLVKSKENFQITFKPLVLKLNVWSKSQFSLVFKRGPQTDQSKVYTMDPPSDGSRLQTLNFENEVFERVSQFYRKKDGSFEDKIVELRIMHHNSLKEDKLEESVLNISMFIGKGPVRESISFKGGVVQELEYEIIVGLAADPSIKEESMRMSNGAIQA